MDEVKHVYTVYMMEPGYDGDEITSATPRISQRFWVDEDVALADFEDIMNNLKVSLPSFGWNLAHCVERGKRLYIDADKSLEYILDLMSKNLVEADLNYTIWYGQLAAGRMKQNAVNAYKAEVLRLGLPFEPGEEEVISDGIGGDEY